VITANLYSHPAHRNPAKIKSQPLANFLRYPDQPENRIPSRPAVDRRRDHEYQAARQMDRRSTGALRAAELADGKVLRQSQTAVTVKIDAK
jgi:hypothetical protein